MRDWGLTNEGTGETVTTDDPPRTMSGIPGYDPDDRDDSDSSTSSSVGSGLLGSDGIILGDRSHYDPSGGDPTDPSTGTVTTDEGQSETIDLGTDRDQAVINSPVVDPESDDVTGSGSNPDGVQRTTDLSGGAVNDAVENAQVGRWKPAAKLAAIAIGAVVLGGIGLVGDD